MLFRSIFVKKNQFSTFDILRFFHQFPVYYVYRNRIIITNPRRLEISNVIFIGFKNLPAFIQRYIDRLFFKHRNFVRVYINDIIIFNNTPEEYIRYLKIVLKIIDENRLNISAAKSFIGYLYVRLLGLISNGIGRSRTNDRIAVFKKI